jgi:hypothetical protein
MCKEPESSRTGQISGSTLFAARAFRETIEAKTTDESLSYIKFLAREWDLFRGKDLSGVAKNFGDVCMKKCS